MENVLSAESKEFSNFQTSKVRRRIHGRCTDGGAETQTIMDLIFTDTDYRQQCGSKVLDYGFKVRCENLTSRTVAIPTGLHYFAGKLKRSQSKLRSTIPICEAHESGLKSDFEELFGKS